MTAQRLRSPDDVRDLLAKRYAQKRGLWLAGEGAWPMAVSLGLPTEKDATQHADIVRTWASAWQSWQGAGALEWRERRWKTMGAQRLPRRLSLADAGEVADWLGETARWQRAAARCQRSIARWPALADRLPRHFDALADYDESDFRRLEALLGWFEVHPESNLYPRQLPVSGIDSKWVEKRQGLLGNLVAALRGKDTAGLGFFDCCGLRPPPILVRLRLLDSELRACAGGLGDISAPINDLTKLSLPVRRVFIVENTQTGLAFEDISGSVVIMGRGYAVEELGQVPWIAETRCIYWGDLDTHGFAILDRARARLPNIESLLMNEATLLNNKVFWGEEKRQHSASQLPRLTHEEQNVFRGLKEQRWGLNVRLEQERIPWTEAWRALREGPVP